MGKTAAVVPPFLDEAVESAESENATAVALRAAEHPSCLEVSGNEHGVPTGIHGGVNVWRGALLARGKQFAAGGFELLRDVVDRCAERFGNGLWFAGDPKNILCGIVVHFAAKPDVIIELYDT